MDEVEECGDTFFKDDNISHPSSKPLLVDDRLLGIKDHPRRHLTSTDRNADDERSDTSADPVRDADIGVYKVPLIFFPTPFLISGNLDFLPQNYVPLPT